MERPLAKENSFVVAVILAAFTVGVFYILQNYGPESAVRRFHNAVAANDLDALARVIQEDVRSPAVRELRSRVWAINETARGIILFSSNRRTREVLVVGQYIAGNGYKFALPWLVQKKNTTNWRINVTGTLILMDRSR